MWLSGGTERVEKLGSGQQTGTYFPTGTERGGSWEVNENNRGNYKKFHATMLSNKKKNEQSIGVP